MFLTKKASPRRTFLRSAQVQSSNFSGTGDVTVVPEDEEKKDQAVQSPKA